VKSESPSSESSNDLKTRFVRTVVVEEEKSSPNESGGTETENESPAKNKPKRKVFLTREAMNKKLLAKTQLLSLKSLLKKSVLKKKRIVKKVGREKQMEDLRKRALSSIKSIL